MNDLALIIDDDRTERRLIKRILKNYVHLNVIECENGHDGLKVLKENPSIKVIIIDLDMPIMDGRETMRLINSEYNSIPLIVLTGSKSINDAVIAMKAGAFDFLSKPVQAEHLSTCVRNALKTILMTQDASKHTKNDNFTFSNLIGHDRGLKKSVSIGKKAAKSMLPVLITGETGTGKELFAKATHGESICAHAPFIAINCGALPENLIESTLFGHEKGSFTGATHKSLGKFQEANGGTIFLDEIGELPLNAQVKLLRVLQQKEVEPVGSGKSVKINVRIISATNRDLNEEIKAGRFREDLYFRLNVLHINTPALRHRQKDIPALTQYFIEKFSHIYNLPAKKISKATMHQLEQYMWPGNVRKLENAINRAMALSEGNTLELDDFTLTIQNPEAATLDGFINPLNLDGSFKTYRNLEEEIISVALEHHNNNISKTARVLEIAKSTIYSKIQTHHQKKSA